MSFPDLHIKLLSRIEIVFKNKEDLHSSRQMMIHFIHISVFCISTFFIGNFCYRNVTNLTAFTEGSSMFLTGVLSVVKLTSFTFKKSNFLDLHERIKDMYLTANGDSKKKLEKINKLISKIIQIYYTLACITCVFFMTLPTYSFLWTRYVVKPNVTIVRKVPINAQWVIFWIRPNPMWVMSIYIPQSPICRQFQDSK